MTNKRIGVTLDADPSGLRRGLNLASVHTGQFAKETEQAMDRASAATERTRTMIGNMARSAASIFAVGKVIGLADEFGQLQSRLEGATKSHAEYVAVQERLVEAAGRSYRSVADGVEVYARTAGTLRQLGFESQSTADLIATMQYGLTIASADANKTSSAVDALSKSVLNGKMGMDEYLSVMNASPRLAQAMADALGVSNTQLMQMVRDGGLTVQQLMAVTSQMEVLGGEADKMKTSVADALGRSWDRLGLRINELNEATGATDALVSAIDMVSENLGVLGTVGGGLAVGYLVKGFGSMSKEGWEAAKAMRAQAIEAAATRPAVQSLAAANLAVAESEAVRARAAVAAATASFNAARGTAQETAAAQALLVARQAGAAADRNAAAAKAAVTAASGGVAAASRAVLGFMGGSAGLVGIAAATAASFLLFRDSTDDAGKSLLDMKAPLEDVVERFERMNKAQQDIELRGLRDAIKAAREEAQTALTEMQSALSRSSILSLNPFEGLVVPEATRASLAELVVQIGDIAEAPSKIPGAGDKVRELARAFLETEGVSDSLRRKVEDLVARFANSVEQGDRNQAMLHRLDEAQADAAASAGSLGGGIQGISAGMASSDWDKYLKGLTDARDVIGMTAQQLAAYQARAKGANDEQAQLAGIIGSQTEAYKTLEKSIQDKDAKAREGAIKVLDDLAKQEAATAALTLRTAALAKLQVEIARGASLAYAESAMAGIDAQAQAAYDAKIAEHRTRLERILSNTTPGSGRSGGSSRATETEGQKLIKSINDRIAALKVEALAYGDVSQAQKELIEFEQRLAREKDASLKASASTVRARLAEADAQERANKAAQQGRDMRKAYADGILDTNADLYESYLRLQDQVATWAVTDREAALNMEALEQARIRERIAMEEQTLWRQLGNESLAGEAKYTEGVINGLNRQLEIRQQLAALGDTAYNQAESRRKIEAQAQDWGKVLDGLRENFQEGFFAALGDRTALSAFGDNLKRSAKTALASAAYEAFAKPIFVRIIADLAGLTGGAGVRDQVLRQAGMSAQAGSNASSPISSAARMLDNAMFNGAGALPGSVAYANWAGQGGGDALGALIGANPQWGMSGIGSWFANAPASSMFSLGGVNSATGMSSAAGGLATAGAGLVGGLLGGAMFGNKGQSSLGGGLGASAGMMVGTSAAVGGTAIGAQLGMAAGPIGAAIGMVLGSALGSLIGAGEKRYGGGYTVGADGKYFRSGGPSGGDPNEAASIATVTGVRDSVRDLAAKLGGDATGLNFAGGWELSPDKGRSFVFSDWARDGQDLSWERGKRDLSGVKDPEKVAEEFALEMHRAVLKGLSMSNLDKAFSEYLDQFDIAALDAAGVAAVTANLDAMMQFRDALTRLPFDDLSGIALDAGLKLAQFSGGIEPLLSNMQTYYDLVYSEEEKVANMQTGLAESFANIGLAIPGSVQELRALVEGLDTTTDAGLQTRAQVYALAGAFGELHQILDAQTEAIASERLGLQKQLLQAEGDTAALRQLELDALDPANRALQERIWLLGDEKAERDKADAKATELKGLRQTFDDIVDPLGRVARQGDALAVEFRELGKELPTTMQSYADLVNETRDMGEAGADTYEALLRLAPGMQSWIQGLKDMDDATKASAKVFADAQQSARDSINQSIGSLQERIILDQLGSDSARHSYYDAQFRTYAELAQTLNDPAAIADATGKAVAAASNAYNLLDADGRAKNNDGYLKTLSELNTRSLEAVNRSNRDAGEQVGKAIAAQLKPVMEEGMRGIRTAVASSGDGSRRIERAIEIMEDTLSRAIERAGSQPVEVTG